MSSWWRKAVFRARARQGFRAVLEQLETRLAPTVGFDVQLGLLRVVGDEMGPPGDVMDISVTSGGFVTVGLNGETRSADPASEQFDPRLAGATTGTVRRIEVFARAGNDVVRIGDGFVAADGQILVHQTLA